MEEMIIGEDSKISLKHLPGMPEKVLANAILLFSLPLTDLQATLQKPITHWKIIQNVELAMNQTLWYITCVNCSQFGKMMQILLPFQIRDSLTNTKLKHCQNYHVLNLSSGEHAVSQKNQRQYLSFFSDECLVMPGLIDSSPQVLMTTKGNSWNLMKSPWRD